MNRRKVVVLVVAGFAIGAAFAAQPLSDWRSEPLARAKWVPGTNGVMAAYETDSIPAAPPQ